MAIVRRIGAHPPRLFCRPHQETNGFMPAARSVNGWRYIMWSYHGTYQSKGGSSAGLISWMSLSSSVSSLLISEECSENFSSSQT
jgi:hypothetical protein